VPFRRLSNIDCRKREAARKKQNSRTTFPLKKRRTLPINLLNVVTGPPLDGRSEHKTDQLSMAGGDP
jgi:hypothetical protein